MSNLTKFLLFTYKNKSPLAFISNEITYQLKNQNSIENVFKFGKMFDF